MIDSHNVKMGLAISALLALPSAAAAAAPQAAYADSETYVLITDTHIGAGKSAEEDTASAFAYAKEQENLAAVINCGDITDVGGEQEYERYRGLWRESGLKVPRIQVMGNHDNATGGYKKWLEKAGYGDRGYTAQTGIELFEKILNGGRLNTVTRFKNADVITVGGGVIKKDGVYSDEMVYELNAELLSAVRAGKMAIVVTHYAPWHGVDAKFKRIPTNQDKILGVCQSYPNVVYACGHEHVFEDETEHYVGQHYSEYTAPNATGSTLPRVGADVSAVEYPLNLLCLNSISRIHGFRGADPDPERTSHVYTLEIDDDGNAVFSTYNQTTGKSEKTASFTQRVSSVSIAAKVPEGRAESVSARISFSDGKSYGGIQSGDVVEMDIGQDLVIDGIPAGVLVTAIPYTVFDDCRAPEIQRVESGAGEGKVVLEYVRD